MVPPTLPAPSSNGTPIPDAPGQEAVSPPKNSGPLLRWGVGILVAMAMIFPASSFAVNFADACSTATDPATCERADYLAQHTDEIEQLLGWGVGLLTFLVLLPAMRRTFAGNL
jgi:hypothetical protein